MKRNKSLDFLRFVGVIMTMISHVEISGNSAVEKVFGVIKVGGWIGVDLFFVLSGFLVSGLIFNELRDSNKFNATRFLIRRGFKIYPTYYLFLLLTWGMTYLFHYSSRGSDMKYLLEALFLSNYATYGPIHAWLWSICVEEHFYFLLCIIMIVLIRLRLISVRSFVTIYLVFFTIGLALRLYNSIHYPAFNFFRDLGRSHLRFDSLFFGVLLNYLYRKDMIRLSSWMAVFAATGIVLCFFPIPRVYFAIIPSVLPWCFGYVMLAMLPLNGRWMRPFAYLGKYSYSTYLFHGLVNIVALKHFSGWAYYGIYFSMTFVVGVAISKLVEYPMLAIRDRNFKTISPAPLAA